VVFYFRGDMSNELALKKIKKSDPNDLEHFISAFATDLLLTQAFAYTAGGLTEYIGYALPGTPKASPNWLIKKLTYSGTNVTDIQFANGVIQFDQIWDSKASLSYS
jgi:hypothetical protein